MKVSADTVHAQLDALQQLCPVLQPVLVQADDALDALLRKGSSDDALHALEAAAVTRFCSCGVCGGEGVTSTADGAEAQGLPEEDVLRLTPLWRLDVAGRRVLLADATFACGLCRALRDTHGVLAAMLACGLQPDAEAPAALLPRLLRHMAAVNRAAASVQQDADACAAWFQEVYGRAYALVQLAAHMRGWQIADATGAPLKTPAAAVAALRGLLRPLPAKRKAAQGTRTKGGERRRGREAVAATAARSDAGGDDGERAVQQVAQRSKAAAKRRQPPPPAATAAAVQGADGDDRPVARAAVRKLEVAAGNGQPAAKKRLRTARNA